MIIWRGWGILSLLTVGAGAGLTAALGLGTGDRTSEAIAFFVGAVLAGAFTFGVGWWLNVIRPVARADKHAEGVRVDLMQRVAAGAFQAAPGVPVPATDEEARAQVERIVETQHAEALTAFRNANTFFFIPMQWMGILVFIAGITGGIGKLMS